MQLTQDTCNVMENLLINALRLPQTLWPVLSAGLGLALLLATGNAALQAFALGALGGVILYAFNFGFARGFASFWQQQRTLGLRAILWMLAFTSILFFFTLEHEPQLHGFYRPLGVALIAGSALFGIGMFLAGTCTSGALNHCGQRHVIKGGVVLTGLIMGGIWAAHDGAFWSAQSQLAPVRLLDMGLLPALAVQLGTIALLCALLLRHERKHNGDTQRLLPSHPWLWAGIGLGIVNLSILTVLHQPWSIATVFPYWGLWLDSHTLQLIEDWDFWEYVGQQQTLYAAAPWQAPVSMAALGLIAGSLVAYTIHGRLQRGNGEAVARAGVKVQPGAILKASGSAWLGGVLMGYGAVTGYGCNIGALFSGIASGSLHGWIWFLSAWVAFGLASRLHHKLKRS